MKHHSMHNRSLSFWMITALLIMPFTAFAYGGTSYGDNEAEPPKDIIITETINDAQLQGEAKRKILFFDVYNLRLFSPQANWSYDAPFAMEFTYLRDVTEEQFNNSIMKALRSSDRYDEESLASFEAEIAMIAQALNEGDISISLYHSPELTEFFVNGEAIGSFSDPELIRAYFDIWFHEDTNIQDIRNGILGLD